MHEAAVMGRAAGENFPVASRVLPARARAHLLALYGFARLADEIGDAPAGGSGERLAARERLAALDELEAELDRACAGRAREPLMARLSATIAECELAREPFARLIEANRMDQRVSSYDTWEQLAGYCELSANPVGELVLGVFGLATPERIARSDEICTALQLAEHCQDVGEDFRADRVYLPAEDLARFGASESDLAKPSASPALREVLRFEVARARALLDSGSALVRTLAGRGRLAVAGFIAGGRAALDAIERADFDVLASETKPRKRDLARRLLGAWR